jgi:CheY-like chemotaxis protein
MVAATTAAMLEDLGHSVLVVSSGALALNLVRSETAIDLVVTDYAMPSMTGVELARQIQQIRPSLPIILATGYADLPNTDDPGLPRLAKPYRREDLGRMLANLVGPEPAPNVVPISGVKRA